MSTRQIAEAVSTVSALHVQMIDRSSIRVYQHGADSSKKGTRLHGSLALRPEAKIPALVDDKEERP